jgi:hypothetical protein
MGKLSLCREILPSPIREHYFLFYRSKYCHRQLTYHVTDSGTTLALVSDSVVSAIYDAIPGSQRDDSQGGYVYPADATVPDVEFAVGENTYKINATDFPHGPAASDGMLFGGIQSRGSNNFDILGDGKLFEVAKRRNADGELLVFLKSVYVVFDQGNKRIGVAQRST